MPASSSYFISDFLFLYHIISYHISLYHIIYHIILYHVRSYHIINYILCACEFQGSSSASSSSGPQVSRIVTSKYSANIWNLIFSILLSIEYKRKPPSLTHCHHQIFCKYLEFNIFNCFVNRIYEKAPKSHALSPSTTLQI